MQTFIYVCWRIPFERIPFGTDLGVASDGDTRSRSGGAYESCGSVPSLQSAEVYLASTFSLAGARTVLADGAGEHVLTIGRIAAIADVRIARDIIQSMSSVYLETSFFSECCTIRTGEIARAVAPPA